MIMIIELINTVEAAKNGQNPLKRLMNHTHSHQKRENGWKPILTTKKKVRFSKGKHLWIIREDQNNLLSKDDSWQVLLIILVELLNILLLL